jgi:hypothetical protein
MTSKSASIQYRYLNTEDLWDGIHLKDMIVDVLKRSGKRGAKLYEDVSERKIDLDQDGSYVVLNKLSDHATWGGPVFCGQLIHVKAGTQLPGILGDLDQSVPELVLQNLSIGEKRQLVEGVLYFAIAENHVGLIEGQRTRARTLERYLTSLLQQAEEFEAGQTVILNAKLEGSVEHVNQIAITPTRSSVSGDVISSVSAGEAESKGATVLDVLETLGWAQEDIAKLQSQVPDDGWIEGLFKVAFKKKRGRKASVDRAALETALRNLDPESVGLLGNGSREKSGTIKLSERKTIGTIGDLLDPEQAMNEIVGMLRHWASSGRIDYDFET